MISKYVALGGLSLIMVYMSSNSLRPGMLSHHCRESDRPSQLNDGLTAMKPAENVVDTDCSSILAILLGWGKGISSRSVKKRDPGRRQIIASDSSVVMHTSSTTGKESTLKVCRSCDRKWMYTGK